MLLFTTNIIARVSRKNNLSLRPIKLDTSDGKHILKFFIANILSLHSFDNRYFDVEKQNIIHTLKISIVFV